MDKLIKILSGFGLLACVFSFLSLSSCEGAGGEEQSVSVYMKTESVSKEAGSAFVTVEASKGWSLGLEFMSGANAWAKLNRTSGSGNAYDVILSYDANEGETERVLEIVLRSGNKTDRWTLVQTGASSADPDPEPSGEVPSWMELPAMSDGLDYYNHHFSMNGKTYRNYSFGWDSGALLAQWVAYSLSNVYLGSQSRTDEWAADPELPYQMQPIMYKGLGGGYDRGHQLPSADRTCCYDANAQTFYFTNMTPQLGQKFNQSIWANFEGKVRSISKKADTLYVVTGCVVDGSTKTHNDNEGKAVTVPAGYFKALLYYSKASTVGTGGYSAAGFYLEHKNYSQANIDKSMCMSIADLEKKTGLDFFANLPGKVGQALAERIETEDPSGVSIWW